MFTRCLTNSPPLPLPHSSSFITAFHLSYDANQCTQDRIRAAIVVTGCVDSFIETVFLFRTLVLLHFFISLIQHNPSTWFPDYNWPLSLFKMSLEFHFSFLINHYGDRNHRRLKFCEFYVSLENEIYPLIDRSFIVFKQLIARLCN